MNDFYPEIIMNLPDIDISIEGVRGKLLQASDHQLAFFDIDPTAKVPVHSHAAQFGVMLEGEMDLTIGGETRTVKKGDTYFIPEEVLHSAVFRTRVLALDLFAEPARYQAKNQK
jgi:quercetin dioxygenase-like cupin family protein